METKTLKIILTAMGLVSGLTPSRIALPCPEDMRNLESRMVDESKKVSETILEDDWVLISKDSLDAPVEESYDPEVQSKTERMHPSEETVQEAASTSMRESTVIAEESDDGDSALTDDWDIIDNNSLETSTMKSSASGSQAFNEIKDLSDTESNFENSYTLLPETHSDVPIIEWWYNPTTPLEPCSESLLSVDLSIDLCLIWRVIRSKILVYEPFNIGYVLQCLRQIFEAQQLSRRNGVQLLESTVLGILRIHHREFLKLIAQSPIVNHVLFRIDRRFLLMHEHVKRWPVFHEDVIRYVSRVLSIQCPKMDDCKLVEALADALIYLDAVLRMDDCKKHPHRQTFRMMKDFPIQRVYAPYIYARESKELSKGFIYAPHFKKPKGKAQRFNLKGNLERIRKEVYDVKLTNADSSFKRILLSLKSIFNVLPFKSEKDLECVLLESTVLDMLKLLRSEFIVIAAKSLGVKNALSSVCGFEDKLFSWKHVVGLVSSVFDTGLNRKADINNPGFAKNMALALIYLDAALEHYNELFDVKLDPRN